MKRDHAVSRRVFLAATPLALLASACSRRSRRKERKSALGPAQNTEPTEALSLRVLQEHLKQSGGSSTSEPAMLPAINRITGFLVENSDVVLFGRQDRTVPGIEVDAFVVALRNAYGAGDDYHGDPGCTIDPIPGDDPFRVQKVSVFGVPNDCLMAARHVRLDYELKRAGAGIPGADGKILPSTFDIAQGSGPCAFNTNRVVNMAHRYWFYPKTPPRPRFERDHQTVSIVRPVGVQLLTEQEFLNRRGERTGATTADPTAQQFADAVTALLESDKVARFAQIVHDFRVIEVARLMHFCVVPEASLSFLLLNYELARVQVPALVGGVMREEQGRTVCESTVTKTASTINYKEEAKQYRYEYRGGVQAKVEVAEADARLTPLGLLKRRVLSSRPFSEALSWEVP